MWFAKLFGGRDQDDSEPSEFPPHPAAQTKAPQVTRTSTQDALAAPKKSKPGKGFDPYNSGSFDKNKAWNRVIR